MKHINDLRTTIALMELSHKTDHFVIGVDDDYILDGHFDTIEAAHAKAMGMMTTGEHHHLDIEARDVNGEMLELCTVYQNEEDDEERNEEDEEEEEENAIAREKCYYRDPQYCSGALWTCDTCLEEFCEGHNHSTSKGDNVECSACERQRLEKENE